MAPTIPLCDLESRARERLSPEVYGYYAGAAGAGTTLAANLAAFDRLRLRPQVLTGITAPDLSITVLGTRLGLPLAVAPMALHGLAHPEGDVATARAAGDVGTAMILATLRAGAWRRSLPPPPALCGSSCTYCATGARLAR
jgi:isopentenyl diphosphate isomerase/L-lactate dehydrogenase-like FMN-dependent dehydrogenase